jgi:hypothetical protein
VAEAGLSGTEASALRAHTVTGPSGSWDASAVHANVVLLPGAPGTLHAAEWSNWVHGAEPAVTHVQVEA